MSVTVPQTTTWRAPEQECKEYWANKFRELLRVLSFIENTAQKTFRVFM